MEAALPSHLKGRVGGREEGFLSAQGPEHESWTQMAEKLLSQKRDFILPNEDISMTA